MSVDYKKAAVKRLQDWMTPLSIRNVTAQNGREETKEDSAARIVISWWYLNVWKVPKNALKEVSHQKKLKNV